MLADEDSFTQAMRRSFPYFILCRLSMHLTSWVMGEDDDRGLVAGTCRPIMCATREQLSKLLQV